MIGVDDLDQWFSDFVATDWQLRRAVLSHRRHTALARMRRQRSTVGRGRCRSRHCATDRSKSDMHFHTRQTGHCSNAAFPANPATARRYSVAGFARIQSAVNRLPLGRLMIARDLLTSGAAGLAASMLMGTWLFRPIRKPVRWFDRHRLVWQERFVPADPNGAGGSGFTLRCGSEHARGGGRDGRRPAKVEEISAHLSRLPRDAEGKRPRHRADRHAGPLAFVAMIAAVECRSRRVRAKADQPRM